MVRDDADEEDEDEEDGEWSHYFDDEMLVPNLDDPDYSPLDEQSEQSCGPSPPDEGRVFLVQEKFLKSLLQVCHRCLSPCQYTVSCEGTQVKVHGQCAAGHILFWTNQDVVRQQPVLNLQLCAAILLSGRNPTAALRMLACIGVQVVTARTFFSIQHDHLWPAIDRVWKAEQSHVLQEAQGRPVTLAGDGRADSPGYCAKYGTYSLLDVENNKILHFEVVQSNEVGGSCRMELEGLKRALEFLEQNGVEVAVLVTDRHVQIKCFLRREKSNIKHEFDVWHVAKGVVKKLAAGAKQSGCDVLGPWVKSISNHLYWAAASSAGHPELIVPKWTSILNHIRNVHVHENDLFPKCAHGDVQPKPWLVGGYVQRLLSVIMLEASEPGPKKQKVATPKPPPLSSSFAKVQKEAVVASHTTRFNN
ncbi:hypothetical protein HPB48_026887 [Haemaphysalis longicornis]|uniref:Uncharacterized protein n=1 Tax=Haemaphysalis longicornis TaxID=44386 RepID=A0A9J6HCL6_HAELO|nr:hypothetical protein HPB48_026887 [Haemaphysalis longicornis]